jgi:hypothetical protein
MPAVEIKSLSDFLDELKYFPMLSDTRDPTPMEISGYPHFENVCSNILAFFFDPVEVHGLGTLFLDAIADIGRLRDLPNLFAGEITVEREVRTSSKNRLDLLITSDGAFILIENKVFATVRNPLGEYARYFKSKLKESRQPLKLLLTLNATVEKPKHGFQNVTHGQFVAAVRDRLGRYIANANTRYVTFLVDFLNTLENLQMGIAINQNFVKLMSERRETVKVLLKQIKTLRNQFRRKVSALAGQINYRGYRNVSRFYWRNYDDLEDTLVYELKMSKTLKLVIDTVLTPAGWQIEIFPREADGWKRVEKALRRAKLKVVKKDRFILKTFAYTETYDVIAPVIQRALDKLAVSRRVAHRRSSLRK